MNRSALCIKMLQILNAHDFVTKKELAERLETNPRNIAEFKKELEIAGYMIETTKGRYGGYRLLDKASLSMIQLSEEEKQAMNDAYSFLKNHHDFLSMEMYRQSFEKIQSSLVFNHHQSDVVYRGRNHFLDKEIQKMIQLCEQAKKDSCAISFEYRSLRARSYQKVEICPYEVLNIQGAYYCLGYCPQKHDFRTYKFSKVRMQNMKILKKHFTRDLDFNVNAYLGKSGLMKDEPIEAEFLIYGENAVLYAEAEMGVNPTMKYDSDRVLHVKTLFEGKMKAMQFLCSLGSSCVILSPLGLKEEMKEEIRKMAQNYL
ncbi:helix-turn-helix transcriptional regulator [Traorella massiliensis]|uniref:helix-turn-helix transcriptional regulator n=1 Tax=Traorella massiliensis TaxID=1903263 RepID=UPI0008F89E9A|nr:WYL domain-containing protein [Traorella massiliensis]